MHAFVYHAQKSDEIFYIAKKEKETPASKKQMSPGGILPSPAPTKGGAVSNVLRFETAPAVINCFIRSSLEESVYDRFLGFLLGKSQRHQLDQLLPCDLSDRRLVD